MGQGLKLPGSEKSDNPGPLKNCSSSSGKAATRTKKPNGRSDEPTYDVPQWSVQEAVPVYQALKFAFGELSFQKRLRALEAQYSRRGVRGHQDQQDFSLQLQDLLVGVYRAVLPRNPWALRPGWEGYKLLIARTAAISEEPQIVKEREDINAILGLPRHTVLRPPAEEPVFLPVPEGTVLQKSEYDRPMLQDSDGDFAHEFWVEDKFGNLRQVMGVLPPLRQSFSRIFH